VVGLGLGFFPCFYSNIYQVFMKPAVEEERIIIKVRNRYCFTYKIFHLKYSHTLTLRIRYFVKLSFVFRHCTFVTFVKITAHSAIFKGLKNYVFHILNNSSYTLEVCICSLCLNSSQP